MLTSNLSSRRKDIILYCISASVSNPSDGLISLTHKCRLLFMVYHEAVLIFRTLLFILCIFYTIWKPNPNHSKDQALIWFIYYVIKISVIKITMCRSAHCLEMLPRNCGYSCSLPSDDLEEK